MKILQRLRWIFQLKESPKKIALSFAIGVFIGISPLIGLHIVLGIFISWLLKLNTGITIIGVCITNPWTIIPIYTFSTWIGIKILNIEYSIWHIEWDNITFMYLINEFKHILIPFLIGTTIVAFLSAIISYISIYWIIIKYKNDR